MLAHPFVALILTELFGTTSIVANLKNQESGKERRARTEINCTEKRELARSRFPRIRTKWRNRENAVTFGTEPIWIKNEVSLEWKPFEEKLR